MAKILLVEDNEFTRDLLSRRLRTRGHEIVVAADGGEGLARAQAESPDLILLDMGLPVVPGWEVARRLKAAHETRGIPIIALTAHTQEDDVGHATSCDDFATKPFEFPQLVAKIDALLARGSSG